MDIFYVYQGTSYKEEQAGQYMWSPKVKKDGSKNPGYYNMKDVKKGDYILHANGGKTVAISMASTYCYDAMQPVELKALNKEYVWNDEGYKIDSIYYDFDIPIIMSNHFEWLSNHDIEGSAFQANGKGKLTYMCHLADEHAIYIIREAIKLKQGNDVLEVLQSALGEIIDEKESEYDEVELNEVLSIIDAQDGSNKPTWNGKVEIQDFINSPGTGKPKPKRDSQRAANALEIAEYYCEFEKTDRVFIRKKGKRYTEPHHLIPMCKYADFAPYRVDVEENIISLCSHCHNLLHYGQFEDKISILEKFYNDRASALAQVGLKISLEQLKEYYK